MDWRSITAKDLSRCYLFHPATFDCEESTVESALGLWETLLRSPAFTGVVIEDQRELEGFGASVFVTDDFANSWTCSSDAGLNCRIASRLTGRASVVLSERQIAMDNAGSGLNLVVLCGRWNPNASPEKAKATQLLLESSFAEMHAGYYLKRMLVELTDDLDLQYAEASHVWRIIRWIEMTPIKARSCRRALAVIEKEDVQGLSGSILGSLFEPKQPKLRLRASDRALLLAALKESTDQDIAQSLHLSPGAVKRRWASMFGRLQQNLLVEELIDVFHPRSHGRRGEQKRHKILAYVRRHPEELRPFVFRARAAAR